mmetsp:Transcript_6980/g.14464  ORF Transcript_6980/g.14464 Transcript_6980/m.14464 type:complete len:151 (-) Transcript_6980:3584-4036(-)
MATAQKARTTSTTLALTETKSLLFTKNLFRAMVSSISYMRNLFPDDCYTDATVGNLQGFKKLRPENDQVAKLIEWIERGVFAALEEKYLSSIVFEIYEGCTGRDSTAGQGTPSKVVESYTFDVQYPESLSGNPDFIDPDQFTKEELKRQW